MKAKVGGTYTNPFVEDYNNRICIKKVKLRFFADRPTINNRIYTRELLKKVFDEAIESNLHIVRNYSDIANNDNCVRYKDIIGIVKSYHIYDNGQVEFDVQPVIDTELFNGWFQLNTTGVGKIDDNNYVKEFVLIALFLSEDKDYLLELK